MGTFKPDFNNMMCGQINNSSFEKFSFHSPEISSLSKQLGMNIDEMTKTQLGIYQGKNRLAQKKQILANLEAFWWNIECVRHTLYEEIYFIFNPILGLVLGSITFAILIKQSLL